MAPVYSVCLFVCVCEISEVNNLSCTYISFSVICRYWKRHELDGSEICLVHLAAVSMRDQQSNDLLYFGLHFTIKWNRTQKVLNTRYIILIFLFLSSWPRFTNSNILTNSNIIKEKLKIILNEIFHFALEC